MKVYSPNDVADLLQIKPATLRKYSLLMERYGYKIEKNTRGNRYYRDKDVMTLRDIITAKSNGVTLEQAVQNVVELDKGSGVPNVTNNGDTANTSDMEGLKEFLHKQAEMITKQTKMIHDLQEQLKERDHYIVNEIQELKEQQQTLLAEPEEKEEPKTIWQRLFNK